MSMQVAEVRNQINIIHEAMKATMKNNVHFGIIPGCVKPSLFKPGAEIIMTLFKLSSDPIVTDLSKDGEIRYQIKVNITNREGNFIGSGIGECSSGEDKYSWRAAICQEEFDATPETLRKIKFKKYNGGIQTVNQIRVCPSDMANTILKMAKKRALIDAVLTATGASDIFSQDIEEIPEEYMQSNMNGATSQENAPEVAKNVKNDHSEDAPDAQNEPEPEKEAVRVISEPQAKRFYAIARGAGIEDTKGWLFSNFNIESSKEIPVSQYEEICKAAQENKK
jgi:hypothetical protein